MKKLPAGEYYVGDPCYCFKGSWSSVLAATEFFKNETVSFNDGFVAATNTAYGDGRYEAVTVTPTQWICLLYTSPSPRDS